MTRDHSVHNPRVEVDQRKRAIDPDARARAHLANERTFLAWFRTGITLVALGLAAGQFLTRDLPIGVPLTRALGVLVVGLGIGLLVVGRVRYRANRINLDQGTLAPAKLSVDVAVVLFGIAGLLAIGFILFASP